MMNRWKTWTRPLVGAVVLATLIVGDWSVASVTAQPDGPSEVVDGKALAEHIRSRKPARSGSVRGQLRIRDDEGAWKERPVIIHTDVTDVAWTVSYEFPSRNREGGEGKPEVQRRSQILSIFHTPGELPKYRVTVDGRQGDWFDATSRVTNVALAGSDFLLSDLGLEFLYWGQQRFVDDARITMRRGRPCYVLESSNDLLKRWKKQGYQKVVSWIDREYEVVLRAEAYDWEGKLWKTFEPDSVQKVDGEYRVKQLEMRDRREKNRSELEFFYE